MSEKRSLAVVEGVEVNEVPPSLYIPPDAIRVFLEQFTGPLDLLYYLVKRDRIDMRNVPVAELTRQYIEYVEQVIALQMDLAADYLLMSAVLIEIKTRMLLPKRGTEPTEEEDPRAELVKRLAEYARIRDAALRIGRHPRSGRDFVVARIAPVTEVKPKPRLDAEELRLALAGAYARRAMPSSELTLERDRMSMREAMSLVLGELSGRGKIGFYRLFRTGAPVRDRIGVMFMAVLELANERLLRIRQKGWDDEIALQAAKGERDES